MRSFFGCLILIGLAYTPAQAADVVPSYLIRLPASVMTAFVAETSAAAFHRFDNAKDETVDYRGLTYMSIGENGAGKERNGDRRTPLGIYFVTEQLDTERMHEKYGVTAFTLDYPNTWDRRLRRTGDGIWVHGVDRRGGKRPRLDTDGCVALPNEDLTTLQNRFVANVTPVVITPEVSWVARSEINALRHELEAVVTRWVESRQRGDLQDYLSLYHDDFRHWEMNKDEWIAFSSERFESRPVERATVGELLLLGDPVEEELYLSRFRLAVTTASNTVALTKRLYWRRAADGALKVIAEDSG